MAFLVAWLCAKRHVHSKHMALWLRLCECENVLKALADADLRFHLDKIL